MKVRESQEEDSMKYAVIIEAGERNYSAYAPDLPGCVAVGGTLDEVRRVMREAVAFHIEGLLEEGLPVPEPTTCCEYVEWQEGVA
jgi:predicted RNase H-like HicB family nuclease